MADSPSLVVAAAASWAAIGLVLSIVMGRRSHDSFAWLVLGPPSAHWPSRWQWTSASRRAARLAPVEGRAGAIPAAGPVAV